MLEQEFKYYVDNQVDLVKKYNNRFIVIVGESVVGDYDTFEDAILKSKEKYPIGTFLVQECKNGKENYTQTFHTRAIFA